MNSYELETTVAGPVQLIGMSYYFDPGTAAAAKEHNLNVFEFYGVGRGGVLGDVDSATVGEAFWFFHQSAVDGLWAGGTAKAEPVTVANAHLDAAYAYAERTFGDVDPATLAAFAAAARKVIDAVPGGRYALFDGYRQFPVPANPVHAAYLATILLRELRGGVHIDTTTEFHITANEACYLNNATIFKLHGYGDDDAPEVTEDLKSRMRQAEELTTTTMAGYLDVLSDDERAALDRGVAVLGEHLAAAQGAAPQG